MLRLAALVALVGCYQPRVECGVRCDDTHTCPNDLTCNADFVCDDAERTCEARGAGCGGVALLGEEFVNALDPRVWDSRNGIVTGDQLVITVPAMGNGIYETETKAAYDLVGGAIQVEVTPATGDSTLTRLRFGIDDTSVLGVEEAGDRIYGVRHLDGAMMFEIFGERDFDRVADRDWRLRESGGRVFFETGPTPDGPWSALGDVEAPAWRRHGQISLMTYTTGDATPREAKFDHLFGTADHEGGGWCPPGALVDDFAGEIDPFAWTVIQGSTCAVTGEDGGLAMTALGMDNNGGCYLRSRSSYDLTRGPITVHMRSLQSASAWAYVFLETHMYEESMGLGVNGLVTSKVTDAMNGVFGNASSHPWDPAFTWLRVSLVEDKLQLEVSSDGLAWKFQDGLPSIFSSVSDLYFGLALVPQDDPSAKVVWDDLNLPP